MVYCLQVMNFKKRRERLFAKNPHCHWCKCLTVPPNPNGGGGPDNMATLDHLFSRLVKQPKYVGDGRTPVTVLACRKCNHARAVQDEVNMGSEAYKAYAYGLFEQRCYYKGLGRAIMGEYRAYAI